MKTNAAQPNLHTDMLRKNQRSEKMQSEIPVYNTSEANPQAGEETVVWSIITQMKNNQ